MFYFIIFVVIILMLVFKKVPRFLYWVGRDLYIAIKTKEKVFREYGVTIYCGRQGAGKTIAMVEYLERMKKKYPKVKVITNFDYKNQDKQMQSWEDIFKIRNGVQGVIFAIDEIQNEYDSTKWKSFPEGLLSEITQQRKQRIKIICSSQVFTRVVKQLREQCFNVVECYTMLGRWTFCRSFCAEDYNAYVDNPDPEKKKYIKREWRHSFIQTDYIRNLYDTYAKVERLFKAGVQDRVIRQIR